MYPNEVHLQQCLLCIKIDVFSVMCSAPGDGYVSFEQKALVPKLKFLEKGMSTLSVIRLVCAGGGRFCLHTIWRRVEKMRR